MDNPNLVELRPLDLEKWHGKTKEENFTRDQSIEVLYDPETGKYATGLTKEEAEKYGKELGLDLSDKFDPENPHPYWSTRAAMLQLPNRTLVFDVSKPLDFIKVKNYKACVLVANSQKEYNDRKWPLATHILYDENEQLEMKAHKINKKREAHKLVSKMTKKAKIAVIQIILEVSCSKQSNDFIEVQLEKAIENHIDDFLKFAQMNKEHLYMRGMVLEAIYKDVLTKEGTGIYYLGEILGHGVEDVTEYFLNPQNQAIKAKILEKIS